MKSALLTTQISNLKEFKRGKVRDIYELSDDRLLIITTDRISAFDQVMNQTIPRKGKILTRFSKFWYGFIEASGLIKTHYISERLPKLEGFLFWQRMNVPVFPTPIIKKELIQRSMIVKKTKVIPVEWIVRGYLAGSAWKKYQMGEGLKKIWPNLQEAAKLPQPMIEYTTKAETGHDQSLDYGKLQDLMRIWLQKNRFDRSEPLVDYLISKSLEIYNEVSEYAESRGVIIADTKLEFGIDSEEEILLIDEVLTPDSSRFWLREKWQPGKPQEAYDKQPLRDWLEKTGWDKNPPPPNLPEEIVQKLSQRYQEILRKLTEFKQ